MIANYRNLWKELGGKFLDDGSADTDSITASRDYKEALRILGCKFEEDEGTDNIDWVSINMRTGTDKIAIPSCEITFNMYRGRECADNPSRVETALSEAIKQYGKKLNSELTHIGNEYAVVWLDFETKEDAKKLYDSITEKCSELDEIYEFLHRNL